MADPIVLKTRFCSSLVKIFQKREDFQAEKFDSFSALKGEVFSFQLAVFADRGIANLKLKALSKLKDIRIRSVESVPVRALPATLDDDAVIREPGLVPDLLAELPEQNFAVPVKTWRSFWITVRIPESCRAGIYDIAFELTPDAGAATVTKPFKLEVIPAVLPEQKLIRTEWFHCDTLAAYYDVPVFSEEHWYLIESFMRNACAHGCNMILTPVFTPPLDTVVGGERPTVQLIDVKVTKDGYEFGYDRLARWIALAQAAGMKYFEISHLFTQWGAEATPKILAQVDGATKQIFGWNVKSTSKKYKEFLKAFLPELCGFLKAAGITEDQVYFHTSDEPTSAHLKTYAECSKLLKQYTQEFHHIDALSEYEFYEHGTVEIPIPKISNVETFIEHGVQNPWTYYCCHPETGASNRFLHSTASRTRIIGAQFYKSGIHGFLHWGFNFYFSRLSKMLIDPFQTADANYAFPPGDPFLVYPGDEGEPLDSIRHETFFDGIQDMRAMTLLEQKIGRDGVVKLIEKQAGGKITMSQFPSSEKKMLALRKAVNEALKKK